ncbi:MAG: putative aminohydrolase SsnA [Spirochaetales bacterium]|jgi:putative selenium metabolism protein SsnA|nr:putative aminohydrolase SsnA [Spirochaetales bacterium]
MLLTNATLVELDPPKVVEGVDIRIAGTRIEEVGQALTPRDGDAKRDMKGMVVMPGLVCGHNHFYSGLARGITANIPASTDFVSNLTHLWWRLDRALDEQSLYYSGIICCLEAIKAGCTSVVDHHASPSFIFGSLDVLKGCFEESGLRGVECYETTDRNGTAGWKEGVEENRRFAELIMTEKTSESRLVESMIGGHAPFTLSDDGLRALGDLVESSGKGFHIHVSEDRFDPSFSHRYNDTEPLRRLADYGLVTGNSLIAHGIYLNADDRALLNTSGATLAHNCRSNMNNSVGYNEHLGELHSVCIGTDGIGADVLEELKFAYFKHRDSNGSLGPSDYVGYLQNGNRVIGRCFDDKFGRIKEGYKADLTVLDYLAPTPMLEENLAGHVLFGMSSRNVHSVLVNGEYVLEAGGFTKPINDLYARARDAAKKLWENMDTL